MTESQTLSDVSVISATSAQVTAATPALGSGTYTYAWYKDTTAGFTPGGGNLVAGQTARTATFTGLTPNTNYWVKCTVSDGSTSVTTFQRLVNISGLVPIIVGAIGDSTDIVNFIGDDTLGDTINLTAPDITQLALASLLSPRNATVINRAVSGTSVGDWITGSTDMNNALAAFASGGMSAGDFVLFRLGVNDAQGGTDTTTFQTRLTSCLSALTGAGYRVLVSLPTYREPGAFFENSGGTTFDEAYAAFWVSYFPIIEGHVNNTTIFLGDTTSAVNSAALPTQYLRNSSTYPGGIHPGVKGVIEQGYNDAIALLKALSEFGGGGVGAILARIGTGM